MRHLQAEIIAVGTELLLGQIANTNAKWLSQQLASYGINTHYHSVVGDNIDRVVNTFKVAHHRSNVMIVTGGLGPTEDDLTREAFKQISHLPLIEHQPSMHKIENYFKTQGRKMTLNNKKQARVFKDAKVLVNHSGMAPGMIVNFDHRTWIFLPGVPREMKQMVKDQVLPYLQKLLGQNMVIRSKLIRTIGIGESHLEDELKDIIKTQSNPTIALLAQNDGIHIRLTAKARSIKKADELLEQKRQFIANKLGDYIYGYDDQTIEKVIMDMFKRKQQRIAAAESLTGGLFTQKLISVEGASKVIPGSIVCYDHHVKNNILKVSKQTLKQYGSVSKECALEMAKNVTNLLNVDYGISFTGAAGPETLEDKQVGTVYIGLYHISGKKHIEKFTFTGDRNLVRRRAVLEGLKLLFHFLKVTK